VAEGIPKAFYKERRHPFYHSRESITEEEYRSRDAFRSLERRNLSQVICAPVHARDPVKIYRRNLFAGTMNFLDALLHHISLMIKR